MGADTGITLVEVAPRDGLQNEAVHLTVPQKLELVARCVDAGARRIEAVSFANPARVPAMAGAEELMAQVPRRPGVRYAGLVMNDRGLDRALACGVDEIDVVAVVTDTFSRRNQNTDTAGALALVARLLPRARAAGVPVTVPLGASFGCPFEGEVPPDRLGACLAAVADAGPAEIALADTIGVAVPRDVHERVALAREASPGTPLRIHLHDTRNTAVANALAAVEAGVTVLDSSIGGAGGCPFAPAATGNVATEDLVYALRCSGIDVGHDLERLRDCARWLETVLERPLPSALLAAGDFPDRSRQAG
ncbi:Hydroxymethylglutaryl-CoA lyase [Pseudonocardia sp. Ae168_Ps1]|uniref:hydroxymethylglutaryl-CoA lyase n=1 Tax=unclassified Pseudonocardia TaxID=2619320 RepID=UPI00094B5554|nr:MULTISPECIES: hydroxymethylglutaryl-CoA lyase [unclassified Pseudonocardia]OLL76310.1 Hydroxymethylglutaryl-CoA lyase [Pseudonocardia sp. Ae150A_Ps1]OLL82309.1 Hydroxymethylglutaryl-CoA lyase [Pseudonocardia sp. Ae168_Ps1]OLL83575.1 Hydroxymethylglutaryl-CoA lyase [Pseudonocardia sp. Ae263_Ps1]OLL90385.1 Hydroxymethylglutaryl-CoA lyase [Pseudonocardia sp. Ae356_Ps1]